MKRRDPAIDLMRTIGILLMFAAHCSLSERGHDLREFDLVVLFFVSGMSFAYSSFTFSKENYLNYLKKRLIRLVLPAWTYLIIFFVIFHFIPGYNFTLMDMIKSFLFTSGGIMFVWVYRVFIGTAVTTPLFLHWFRNLSDKLIILGTVPVLLINDLIYTKVLLNLPNETVSDLLTYLITYTIGYGIITFLGARYLKFEQKDRILMTAVYAIVFVALAVFFRLDHLEAYKFPPQTYYISYGLMWSGFLYLVLSKYYTKSIPFVSWVSANCMRLYLAHIALYYLFFPYLPNTLSQYVVLFGGSCIQVLLYNACEKWMKERKKLA